MRVQEDYDEIVNFPSDSQPISGRCEFNLTHDGNLSYWSSEQPDRREIVKGHFCLALLVEYCSPGRDNISMDDLELLPIALPQEDDKVFSQ